MDPTSVGTRLLYKGAEADLHLSQLGPWEAVVKHRVKKAYRTDELDKRIRRERTVREATALREAKGAGARTPSVLDVDPESYAIIMTYVKGQMARESLDARDAPSLRKIIREVGRQMALLHVGELVHGDLTTSNIIISEGLRPFLLDFGMSRRSTEAEDMGVDIHLFQRSIAASHRVDSRSCVRALALGYKEAAGERQARLSFRKAAEIARRGRYFAIR